MKRAWPIPVFAFGIACCYAQSQPPTPSPGQSGQSQQQKASPEIKKTNADGSPYTAADAFLDGVSPPTTSPDQHRSAYDRIEKAVSRWTYRWGQVTSAIVVAFFTCILTIVAFLQWRTYTRQADLMERGLAATERAADAAKKSAGLAEVALQTTERADVLVDKMCMENMAPISVGSRVVVVLKNFGRTVAKDVRTEFYHPKRTGVQSLSKPLALAAGQPVTIMAEIVRDENSTTEYFNNVNSGKTAFTVELIIHYDDTFGFPHTVEYTGTLTLKDRQFCHGSVQNQPLRIESKPATLRQVCS